MRYFALMNRSLFAVCFVFLAFKSQAQIANVTGNIFDEAGKQAIEYASVVLLKSSDSSSIGFTFSEEDGSFIFKNVPAGSYILQVFHTGYELVSKPITMASIDVATGTLYLKASSERLSTALVTAKAIPVVIRGDTLVYNPNAFKTKNNATVEDLLKKLPGVQVSKDGTVTAQGEQVIKVLVNGKEFFGNDPTKATQNIDAESLEKVEIIDKKSDDSEFSGVDDGSREKVINLVLKEDANKGYFGKLEIGGGTEDTYLAKGTVNYFKKENQITAIGNLNNLNQNGFDWREYYQMLNGSGGINLGERTYWSNQNQWLGSSDKGRQENGVLGTNAHVKINDKSFVDASYFFMNRSNSLISTTKAENYLPDAVILSNSSYDAKSTNGQHKGIFKYTWKPDTLNWIELGAEGDFSQGNTKAISLSENRTSFNEGGFLNTSMSRVEKGQFNNNIKSSLIWRHKMKTSRNSFNLQVGTEMNDAGDTSQWVSGYSLNEVSFSPDLPFVFRDNASGTGTILYGKASFNLGIDSFSNVNFTVDNKMTLGTYKMRRLDLVQDSIYQNQSPNIDTRYRVSKAQVSFSKNGKTKKGWYSNIGFGVINIDVERELTESGDQEFANGYLMPSVNFYFGHHKPNKHRFGTWFSTREQFPGTNQINPIRNYQNPIYRIQGNFDLDPYVNYNWGANYNKQNRAKHRYFHINTNHSFTPNAVMTSQLRDTNNVSDMTYLNQESTLWNNLNLYYSFRVEKLNMELGLDVGANNYQFYTSLNDQVYKNSRLNFSTGIDVSFDFDDLELSFEYSPDYSLQTAGFVANNPSYWSHNFVTDIVYDLTDRIQISSEFDVFYFEGQQVGQKQLISLLNSEIQWSLDSNERWTLGVIGYDILNQNQNIDRNFFGNSFSETRQNSITRFFMFSVKYSIRKGKKKQQKRSRHWG
ncbi:MAG: hypothetical protein ACI9JN_001479 [Bacteroidia bacterium]|jgi:hypothetical protein